MQTGTAGKRIAALLERNLLSELRSQNSQGENSDLILTMSDEHGDIAAGLCGSTSYGWLLVKVLWVRADQRRRGHATALLATAAAVARERGCGGIWLDTSDPDAAAFYRHAGFECFGLLSNEYDIHPNLHQRLFLRRKIGD